MTPPTIPGLQFGLDAVVEENAIADAKGDPAKEASIRPRRCRRGEPATPAIASVRRNRLQFGLDAVVEENRST